jgi:Zn-dependent protease with chaperone function
MHMRRSFAAPAAMLAGALALGGFAAVSDAQTSTRTRSPLGRFNLFTVGQDIQLGQQSAVEAEKQLPLLNVPRVDRYVNQIVQRLKRFAPGAQYPYAAKVVNAPEINAFSLPGGPLYVHRGLIDAAKGEAELAGVISHEMAHIALRHGTSHVSNAYLGQTGLGLLGGLIGKKSNTVANIVNSVGGVGLNAAFLKFSRDDEYEADRAGALMMAQAGYSPYAMADFFARLRQEQGSNPGKLEQFFSSHPPAADRETRIRQLASTTQPAQAAEIGGFPRIQSAMTATAVGRTRSDIWPTSPTTAPQPAAPATPYRLTIPPPSTRFLAFNHPNGFFTLSHPDNWQPVKTPGSYAITIAPLAGIVTRPNGQQSLGYGVVINHYHPFEGESARWDGSIQENYAPFERRNSPRGLLEDATDDLVRNIIRANPYLKATRGSAKPEVIDDMPAYSVLLTGISPLTGEEETVKAFTRSLSDDHVIYALCIAPTREFAGMDRTFSRMVRTLIVNEQSTHGVRQ